jgi:fibronectin type 3 domain-containing protein
MRKENSNMTLIKKDLLDILKNLTIALSIGGTITLAWDANTESDLAGYKIYYGIESGKYGEPLDVGKVTEKTIPGFIDGETYYFAATAYDDQNNESAYSEELTHTFSGGEPKKNIQMPGGYKRK